MLSTWMLISLAAGLTTGADTPSDWHADYGVALAETKQAEQPLLVVLEAPADEAQSLNPELLSAESGAFPLGSYEVCRIDVSTDYGKEVAKVFRVTEFPHVAIIDKTGSVILRRVRGDVSTDQWKSILAQHESGARQGRTRYTVAKPVIDGASAAPVSSGATFSTSVSLPGASVEYAMPTSSSYCPSCQRR